MTHAELHCTCFPAYMQEARVRLQGAIAEHKWYLSEKAGHDVGYDSALEDFLFRHFDRFVDQVRREFCRGACPEGDDCRVPHVIGALPPTEWRLRVHAAHYGQDALHAHTVA